MELVQWLRLLPEGGVIIVVVVFLRALQVILRDHRAEWQSVTDRVAARESELAIDRKAEVASQSRQTAAIAALTTAVESLQKHCERTWSDLHETHRAR